MHHLTPAPRASTAAELSSWGAKATGARQGFYSRQQGHAVSQAFCLFFCLAAVTLSEVETVVQTAVSTAVSTAMALISEMLRRMRVMKFRYCQSTRASCRDERLESKVVQVSCLTSTYRAAVGIVWWDASQKHTNM